jgi:YVTN family beta-propeller protein
MKTLSGSLLLLVFIACSHGAATSPVARHSSSIAISPDGVHLYVVNADADSVSIINASTRQIEREILLAPSAPVVDAAGRYTPAVGPRALALSPRSNRLYVSGERSGKLYTIDLGSGTVTAQVDVGSEPVGVLVSPDESSVYVACSSDATVVRVNSSTGKVAASGQTARKPWALAWSSDGQVLYTSHLLGSGLSVLDRNSLKTLATWAVPDVPSRGDRRLAYGEVRGLYDAVVRPGSHEIWVPHLMLATATAQPLLDFESTVFPTLSIVHDDGSFDTHLSTDAADVPGVDGAFGDVVSGPHAVAFTSDGRYALVVDSASEDVLAVDAVSRVEATMLRPLPGHMPEGLVLSPDNKRAYVDERNSGDVAVLALDTSGAAIKLSVDGEVISRFAHDPMPMQLRQGQHLFFSANSDELPITRNHWVACASCHIEGRSDAVVWRFTQGPRDTPSNAGGTLDTGFLHHTADRTRVQDYWHTIDDEQGGQFNPTDPVLASQLDAVGAFINHALPAPVPPHTDPALVAQGRAIFLRPDVGCAVCHNGPALTDSGAGNATLDLGGTVLLHDVGTCAIGGDFPDVAHTDVENHPRDPCQYDTPALRGLDDSAPYFHDGSSPTLRDALVRTTGKMGHVEVLSPSELGALVEYLRSL